MEENNLHTDIEIVDIPKEEIPKWSLKKYFILTAIMLIILFFVVIIFSRSILNNDYEEPKDLTKMECPELLSEKEKYQHKPLATNYVKDLNLIILHKGCEK